MINDLGEGILGGQRPVFEFSGKKNLYIFRGEKIVTKPPKGLQPIR